MLKWEEVRFESKRVLTRSVQGLERAAFLMT